MGDNGSKSHGADSATVHIRAQACLLAQVVHVVEPNI